MSLWRVLSGSVVCWSSSTHENCSKHYTVENRFLLQSGWTNPFYSGSAIKSQNNWNVTSHATLFQNLEGLCHFGTALKRTSLAQWGFYQKKNKKRVTLKCCACNTTNQLFMKIGQTVLPTGPTATVHMVIRRSNLQMHEIKTWICFCFRSL